jgi:F-type H+-transporting ATPase subunit alpha
VEVLKQGRDVPIPVEKQVALLYAVTHDVLRSIKVEDIHAFEEGLYSFLDSDENGRAAMNIIRETKDLGTGAEESLKAALETYTATFKQTH